MVEPDLVFCEVIGVPAASSLKWSVRGQQRPPPGADRYPHIPCGVHASVARPIRDVVLDELEPRLDARQVWHHARLEEHVEGRLEELAVDEEVEERLGWVHIDRVRVVDAAVAIFPSCVLLRADTLVDEVHDRVDRREAHFIKLADTPGRRDQARARGDLPPRRERQRGARKYWRMSGMPIR